MSVGFFDAAGAERVKRACGKVLDGPQDFPPQYTHPVADRRLNLHRAVYVTSSTATSGRYPCKLQYRDEGDNAWEDFDPSVTGWAIDYGGGTLEANNRYGTGMLVGVAPNDGAPVFAVVKPGGASLKAALAFRSNYQTISGADSWTTITWEAEDFDYGDLWTASAPTDLIAPSTLFIVGAYLEWVTVAGGKYSAALYSAGIHHARDVRRCNAGDDVSMTLMTLYTVGAPDEWIVEVRQGSGSDAQVRGSFWVAELGGVGSGGGGAGAGTVTSVAMSVPSGLSVSGSPITASGTLALSWTDGSGPATVDGGEWT